MDDYIWHVERHPESLDSLLNSLVRLVSSGECSINFVEALLLKDESRMEEFYKRRAKFVDRTFGIGSITGGVLESKPTARYDIIDELNNTYIRKNKDYGDSFSKSLDKHGLIAACVRMEDKLGRFANLIGNDRKVSDESLRDTIMDLANYAIMTATWIDESQVDHRYLYDNPKEKEEKE